jgi:hypothetical protein
MKKRLALTLTALAALLVALPARAADDTPSFKKRGDREKEFMGKVAASIIKAGRLKPQKIALNSYELKKPKANRTEIHMKAEYYGFATKKRYVADIVVICDSTDKEKWEVLNIKYSDTNPSLTKPNMTKIQALIKELNK